MKFAAALSLIIDLLTAFKWVATQWREWNVRQQAKRDAELEQRRKADEVEIAMDKASHDHRNDNLDDRLSDGSF